MKKFLLKILTVLMWASVLLLYMVFGNEALTMIIGNHESYKDNLLINVSTVNMIFIWGLPVIVLVLIVLYFKLRKYSGETKIVTVYSGLMELGQMEKKKPSKSYNIIFALLIVISLIGFIYCVNEYTVIFNDRIEKHSIFSFRKTSHKYEDIKEASIGVWATRYGMLYYNINFKDGDEINIAVTNLSSGNTSLDGMIKVNDNIINKDIKRNIDKRYFNRIIDGLDDDYVKKYEKLFHE